jgi:protein ImuB
MTPDRVMVVWCPDWSVTAGVAAEALAARAPAAVVSANRIVACSATARAQGVRCGQRRREAQGCCPELAVLTADPDRDARAFEPVVAAVEGLAPGVEVVRPGLIALPARGPARYFGGEPAVAERVVDVVTTQARVECQIGIADGLFAATLAAHRGLLVPPEGSPGFLAPLSIAELRQDTTGVDRAALVDLLRRLGLRTLGAFAALPVDGVASRFGLDGVRAHRLARGLDERPLARRHPPVDLTVTRRFDPPLDRVDAVAFASREPAEQLHAVLAARGLACVRLGVGACTEAGEELYRVWRCAEPLTASGIADRVRWQLDGWLTSSGCRPSTGITLLQLVPDEVIGGQALQRGLWGESGEDGERAGRALVRVQAMLGPDAVFTGVIGGGRDPTDRVRLVPWGDDRVPARGTEDPLAGSSMVTEDPLAGSSMVTEDPLAGSSMVTEDPLAGSSMRTVSPWPGRLPAPSPSRVPTRLLPAEVLDGAGCAIGVSGRGRLTGVPYRIAVDGNLPRRVLAWAGPWPVEERWWEPGGGRRCARLQAVLDVAGPADDPLAVLLTCETGRWRVEGIYE